MAFRAHCVLFVSALSIAVGQLEEGSQGPGAANSLPHEYDYDQIDAPHYCYLDYDYQPLEKAASCMWTGPCAVEGCGDRCLANSAHVGAAGGSPYLQAQNKKTSSTFACLTIADFIAFVPDFGEYDYYGSYNNDYNAAPEAGAGPSTEQKLKGTLDLKTPTLEKAAGRLVDGEPFKNAQKGPRKTTINATAPYMAGGGIACPHEEEIDAYADKILEFKNWWEGTVGSDYEYADGLIDGVAITPAALKAYLANNCVTAEVSGALKDAVADFGEWSIGLHEIGRGASVESLTICRDNNRKMEEYVAFEVKYKTHCILDTACTPYSQLGSKECVVAHAEFTGLPIEEAEAIHGSWTSLDSSCSAFTSEAKCASAVLDSEVTALNEALGNVNAGADGTDDTDVATTTRRSTDLEVEESTSNSSRLEILTAAIVSLVLTSRFF